jgi:hypothetical protein
LPILPISSVFEVYFFIHRGTLHAKPVQNLYQHNRNTAAAILSLIPVFAQLGIVKQLLWFSTVFEIFFIGFFQSPHYHSPSLCFADFLSN